MASITFHDLPHSCALDHQAMALIRGGDGAPWIYGWIQPFTPSTPSVGPVVANLYQITNNFYAGQMINQFQSINVNNTGTNANITASPDERSTNHAA